jgi:hypothetical protein
MAANEAVTAENKEAMLNTTSPTVVKAACSPTLYDSTDMTSP